MSVFGAQVLGKTTIQGSIGTSHFDAHDSTLLKLINHEDTTLSEMTIKNTSTRSNAIAISNIESSVQLLNLEVIVQKAVNNYGIYNYPAEVDLKNVRVIVGLPGSSSNRKAFAVSNKDSIGDYKGLNIAAYGGSGSRGLNITGQSDVFVIDSNFVINPGSGREALYIDTASDTSVVNTLIQGHIIQPSGKQCFHVYSGTGAAINC